MGCDLAVPDAGWFVKKYTHFTLEKREHFLESLRQGHTVKFAAQAVGVTRRTAYLHRDKKAAFAEAWAESESEGTEALEQEARRRAVDGVTEAIYDKKGQMIGETTRYSDTLLIFLLKGRKPDTYRDNVKVDNTGQVTHKHEGSVLVIGGSKEEYLSALHRARNGQVQRVLQ